MTAMIKYDFWLTFTGSSHKPGAVPKITKSEPQLARGERSARCTVMLPASLFKTPTIVLTVDVPESETPALGANVKAAVDAFKETIGLNVDLKFIDNEGNEA